MSTLLLRSVKGSELTEVEMDGNLTFLNDQSLVKSPVVSSVSLGAISAGDTISLNTTLNQFIEQLLVATYNPTLTAPSFSLSNNAGSLRKIGSVINVLLTFNFNRGSILGANNPTVWDPAVLQNYRAGSATSYTINSTTQSGNTLTVTNHTVVSGNNTFSGTVTYGTGSQPLDSDGNPYDSPLSGGTSSSQTTSFEGVYPIFATTSSIGTLSEQGLYSMISGNAIELTLVAETGGDKQKFELPNSWVTSRPLTKIEYFNTVSNQFDTTNKISDFTVTTVSETVEGSSITYKRYTNSAADRGQLKIKLTF